MSAQKLTKFRNAAHEREVMRRHKYYQAHRAQLRVNAVKSYHRHKKDKCESLYVYPQGGKCYVCRSGITHSRAWHDVCILSEDERAEIFS